MYSHALIIQRFAKVSTKTFISRPVNLSDTRARFESLILVPNVTGLRVCAFSTALRARLRRAYATTPPVWPQTLCHCHESKRSIACVGGRRTGQHDELYIANVFGLEFASLERLPSAILNRGCTLLTLSDFLSSFADQKRRYKMYDLRISRA